MSWLVIWAATCINRYKLDRAGRTAFNRVTGGEQRRPIAKFGERVWWIENGPRAIGEKADTRLREGVFLGIMNQTTEI